MSLASDFAMAVAQLPDPRFRKVLVKAVAVTLVGLAVVFWALVLGLGWLLPEAISLPVFGEVSGISTVLSWAAIALMLAASAFLMVPVAAGVVGFFLDDVAAAVEDRYYPAQPPLAALGLGVQIGDALRFLAVMVAVNLAALFVYLMFPPIAPLIFWAANGFLLGREYFQLVAMRHEGADGAKQLRKSHNGAIWARGAVMAVPLSVPLLNLVVPIVGVAAFTHYYNGLAGAAKK